MSQRLYRFILNGFDVKEYWEEKRKVYDLSEDYCEDETNEEVLSGSEKIEEYYKTEEPVSNIKYDVETLKHADSDRYIRYMGNCNDKHKLWVVDIGLLRNISMPLSTERRCNRCHHTFTTSPIGCPIHYINLSENTLRVKEILAKLLKFNIKIDDTSEIFITSGVFCTLNCLAAWINIRISSGDVLHEKYKSMFTLLVQKLEKIYGKKLNVQPSPDISILDCYGGHLDIDKYRHISGNLIYKVSKNIQAPLFYPVGSIVEEMLGIKMNET